MILKSVKFTKFKPIKESKFKGWVNVIISIGEHTIYLNSIKYYSSNGKQWLLMPESESKHRMFNIDDNIRNMILDHINTNVNGC